ncbi:hypothetical protein M9Y10_034286 [Tritrichomonas musculus]|uniref:Uncharacterized protein n=1 Tax=Tritrichomonas musculus TaxID=1915356 RepID=A0ABR2KFH3_9EUKA
MSFEYVEFQRVKTSKPKKSAQSFAFSRPNSFSTTSSYNGKKNSNLSPLYTNYGNSPTAQKGASSSNLFYYIISLIKSIFSFLYLFVTDFSMKRVKDMLYTILDYAFLKPYRAIKNNKVFIIVIFSVILIMCMGFVMDFARDSHYLITIIKPE